LIQLLNPKFPLSENCKPLSQSECTAVKKYKITLDIVSLL
jgi:hypothetical protein